MCVQYKSEHVLQQAGEDKGQHDQMTFPATYWYLLLMVKSQEIISIS